MDHRLHEKCSAGCKLQKNILPERPTCAQAIIRFCLRNLRGFNVGITDDRYL
jgi:hypothetical protein